jgi:hypothetical protein
MIVENMQEIGEFAPFSTEGAMLSVGEHVIDCEELQGDDQVIIDLMEEDRFLANVIIPPARYAEVRHESTEDSPPPEKLPVDMDAVRLILWSRPILEEGE